MEHKTAGKQADEGVLNETARAIGGAAGKLAALANSVLPHHQSAPAPAKKKVIKLSPAKKTRLPRKQKKMMARRKTA